MTILISLIKKAAKIFTYLICILIAIIVLPPIVMLMIGYKVNAHSDELARKLVDSGRDPEICMNIVNYGLLGPSSGESRAHCVKRYAEYAKDPSACELLMPSSDGWSCVGAAKDFDLPCATEKYKVFWNESNSAHQATLQECYSSQSSMSGLGRQCCTVARIRYVLSENDCTQLKENVPIYDRCLYGLAWKKKDSKVCDEITNQNAKAACIVQSAALQKDPSICENCTQALERVEDLK